MAETAKKPPPYIAWGLWRENNRQGAAMEWRELGPVFTHDDGSGGFGHLKSIPTSGWNYRFTFRPYGAGPPPLPVIRKGAPQRQQQPTDDAAEEPDSLFSGDDETSE